MGKAINKLFVQAANKCPEWLWKRLEKKAVSTLDKVDDCAVCFYWRARFSGWFDVLLIIGVLYVLGQACSR